MSLFNALNTGASGMGASSTTLSVIGDNLANLGTTGFKSSSATFADAFPGFVGSLGGGAQIGNGAMVGDVAVNFAQGSLNQTGSPLDVAILGSGMFAVRGSDDQLFYTRDGSFHLDADNNVVNSAGLHLQGYSATDGVLGSTIGDLTLPTGDIPQQATGQITVDATLSADADASTEPFAALVAANPLDGSATAPTMESLSQAADFSTSVTVYDSLGTPHDVTLFFERSSADPTTWNVTAASDGAEIDTTGDGQPDGVGGNAFALGTGTVQFDTDGKLVNTTGISLNAGWTFPGASPFTANFDLGMDPTGNPTDGNLSMNGTSSFLTTISQDGYPAGSLQSLRVDQDGTLVASYTNGQDQVAGQLALATFPSDAGLQREGGNLYSATPGSGTPALGAPGIGGRGSVTGYALEGSNVDMEGEFVHMIQAQRTYQANTGVIRTADEALQQLIQLV